MTIDKKFHLYEFKTEKSTIEQDLPKEDYLFCQNCEKRLQTIESKISIHLKNSYNILKRREYPIFHIFDNEHQYLEKCDSKIFTLFVYSLIWRAHISSLPLFKDFVLPESWARNLRTTLNEYLPDKISDLENRVESFDNQRFPFVFIKPKNKRKFYHAITYNEKIGENKVAMISIWEYGIMFFSSKSKVPKFLIPHLNDNFQKTQILIMNNKSWNNWIIELYKLIKKNYAR